MATASTNSVEIPNNDRLLASAVQFLIDGGEHDAASMLLSCSLEVEQVRQSGCHVMATISVRGPRSVVDLLNVSEHFDVEGSPPDETCWRSNALASAIRRAISSVLPAAIDGCTLKYRGQLVELDSEWREELAEIARGKSVHNQAIEAERVVIWMNHRFRSQAEVRVAQALEGEKVLFLPNCKARLGFSSRENREPDFLICADGKWGILEVDGPYHPRAVDDHERDRLFKAHGIVHIERFDAAECFENAAGVVKKFLFILRRGGK